MASAQLNSSVTELGGKFVLDLNATASSGSTNNVTAAAGSVFLVQIDNEANTTDVFVKLKDATSASPSVVQENSTGTSEFIFKAPAYKKISYAIPAGAVFSNGISMWCTTSSTTGTTNDPSKPIIVKLICS